MNAEHQITEVTRREIVDFFALSGVDWAGRLAESEFLARLFDLSTLPSTDYRFQNAAADIRQHRENWRDWEDAWVFYDARFNLLHGPDEKFLAFLCETVHPVIRPDEEDTRQLVEEYNDSLARDGWEILERTRISGHPVFAAREIGSRVEVLVEPTGWEKLDRQLQEVKLRLETATTEEQYQAVGLLCREALITLAQTIYDPALHKPRDGVTPSSTDAARMLKAFFNTELAGGANEELRSHAKGAVKVAVALQHKRSADFRMAALCAEGTTSVVNIVAVLRGRRR